MYILNNCIVCVRRFNKFFIPRGSYSYQKILSNFFSDSINTDSSDRFRHLNVSDIQKSEIENEFSTLHSNTSKNKSVKNDINCSLDDYSFENVESALMQFVPEYISSADENKSTFMTPGQAFFLENKEKLMETVKRRYYEEKDKAKYQQKYDDEQDETFSSLLEYDFNEESFGSYGEEFIPPRNKQHLWDYNSTSVCLHKEPIELTKGVMPNINQIVDILQREQIIDISVMDMDKYERRDQGLYVILGTGTTSAHCRRVGRMLYNIIIDLEIPFVSKVSYCCNSRSDEWIISHLGPLSVHLMIKKTRDKYSLDEVWSEHFLTKRDISQELLAD
ncbi:Oligomerization domain protein [Theileria parva strain Muguga]|uniref:Oligomerization domain protein n=1 Tax=Theileria parva strain Muguga TaxID=333668 RepID=UPI001C61CF2D|nr:Oligomerization domain protein [Theileria parva strain Muguga]KAF5153311.1 Oligomerization domain protein [Theileria parva strain Muguga]